MVYIIYNNQFGYIQKRVNKIADSILKNNKDEYSLIKLDGEEATIFNLLDECATIPLGYEHKVVWYHNANFLVEETKKLLNDESYQDLLSYIANPNQDVDLILSIISEKIDNKSKLCEEITKNGGTIFEYKKPTTDEWQKYVTKKLDDNKIKYEYKAALELARRTFPDLELFNNSLDKLMLYGNSITMKEIELLVEKPLEDNAFNLFNYLLDNKKKEALDLYRDLKIQNNDPTSLLSLLAGQFRSFNTVMYLAKTNHTVSEIASILKMNEYRAKILSRNVYKASEAKIIKALEDLHNLDYQIKSGQIDRDYGFELFLINY